MNEITIYIELLNGEVIEIRNVNRWVSVPTSGMYRIECYDRLDDEFYAVMEVKQSEVLFIGEKGFLITNCIYTGDDDRA